MKALTLWQPWASLVAIGAKKVETRCWFTKHRGPLAIHSAQIIPYKFLGKSRHSAEFKLFLERALPGGIPLKHDTRLPLGKVLCIVNLVAVEPITPMLVHDLTPQERAFGNYEEHGRYAWFLEVVGRFEEPIPARGNRLLWNWSQAA
jgi:hypothetical protein